MSRIIVLYFLSGLAALVFELAWGRHLNLILGSTTAGQSLALAAFLGGLGFGAILGTRTRFPVAGDAASDPLRAYGRLQLFAGVWGLLFPVLAPLVGSLILPFYRDSPPWGPLEVAAKTLGALALVFPPALALGATFPVLARFFPDEKDRGALGRLYAWNTIGAFVGAFAYGFFLLERLGIAGSSHAVAGICLVVGLLAALRLTPSPAGISDFGFRISARPEAGPDISTPAGPPSVAIRFGKSEIHNPQSAIAGPPPPESPSAKSEIRNPKSEIASPFPPSLLLFLTAGSGFCLLLLELCWTRLLVLHLESLSTSYSGVIGSVILFLGIGAWFGSRARNPILAYHVANAAAALASALSLLLIRNLLVFTRHDFSAAGPTGVFGACALTVGLPAFFIGALFPLALRLYPRSAVKGSGALSGAGALGSLAAGVAAPLLLFPILGYQLPILIASFFYLLAAAAVLPAGGWGMAGHRVTAFVLESLALLLILVIVPFGEPFLDRTAAFLRHSYYGGEPAILPVGPSAVPAYREGREGIAAVVADQEWGHLSLYTDAFSATGTRPSGTYMRLMGHLPVLLAAKKDRVLVVGLGTGTTAGAAWSHRPRELVVAELVPEVKKFLPLFGPWNGDLALEAELSKGSLRIVVDDARNVLRKERGRFDAITCDPLPPYQAGAVHLYSKEFYELCRSRLAPGGVFCQWAPAHLLPPRHFRSLVATFTEVFPEASLWFFRDSTFLIGTADPLRLDAPRLLDGMRAPLVEGDLRRARVPDLASLLRGFIASGPALRGFAAGAQVIRDLRPVLEFTRPSAYEAADGRAAGPGELARAAHPQAENLRELVKLRAAPVIEGEGRLPPEEKDFSRRFALHFKAWEHVLASQVGLYDESARGLRDAYGHLLYATVALKTGLGLARDPDLQARMDEINLHRIMDQGRAHKEAGDLGQAARFYEQAREAARQAGLGVPGIHANLAGLLNLQGDFRGAEREAREAVRLNPFYARAWNTLSVALQEQGKTQEARFERARALKLDPKLPEKERLAEAAAKVEEAPEPPESRRLGEGGFLLAEFRRNPPEVRIAFLENQAAGGVNSKLLELGLGDEDSNVRKAAVEIAASLSRERRKEIRPKILSLLGDPNARAAHSAAIVLLRWFDRAGLPFLQEGLSSEDPEIREGSARALVRSGDAEACERLKAWLPREKSAAVKAGLVPEIERTPDLGQAAPLLLILLRDPDRLLQVQAVQALRKIARLDASLSPDSPEAAYLAVRRDCERWWGEQVLGETLKGLDGARIRAAAGALSSGEDRGPWEELLGFAPGDRPSAAEGALLRGIRGIGDEKVAVPCLLRLLRSQRAATADMAVEQLAALTRLDFGRTRGMEAEAREKVLRLWEAWWKTETGKAEPFHR